MSAVSSLSFAEQPFLCTARYRMHDGIENLDEGKVQPPPPRKRRRHWWIYIVGPLTGGCLLAAICWTGIYVRRRVFQEEIVKAFRNAPHSQAEWYAHTRGSRRARQTINRIPATHADNFGAAGIDVL